jgi:DNA-binding LacI/PurR family transcriptional regulator
MHNVGAARAATEHLIGIGRKRIAVIGAHPVSQDDIRSANLRIRGYREALDAAGIPYDPALVRVAAPWHRENGVAAMRQLLAESVHFDSVFTFNDTLGLGALRALGEAGVRVPEDVALIGFDNIDEARFSVPSMTSVDPGRDEIATVAVQLLIDRINAKGTPAPPRQVLAKYAVVERESTGFLTREEPTSAVTLAAEV